jgi:hypothetical protein
MTGFPNDQPPTLFHPASPKLRAEKPVKDVDEASMVSTSTFASTVSLLKENMKAKFHSKDKNPRKSAETTVVYEKDGEKTPIPKEPSARAQTAEAYRIIATMK